MGKAAIEVNLEPSATQQSGRDDADINVIVERAKRGAILPNGRGTTPMYGDFTVIPKDLREVLLMVNHANDLFMTLDPFVRRRFNNDPAEMLDFLNDSNNRDEAVKLGLVEPPKADVVVDTKVSDKDVDSSKS